MHYSQMYCVKQSNTEAFRIISESYRVKKCKVFSLDILISYLILLICLSIWVSLNCLHCKELILAKAQLGWRGRSREKWTFGNLIFLLKKSKNSLNNKSRPRVGGRGRVNKTTCAKYGLWSEPSYMGKIDKGEKLLGKWRGKYQRSGQGHQPKNLKLLPAPCREIEIWTFPQGYYVLRHSTQRVCLDMRPWPSELVQA